jgi:ATP-dependent DNA helicase RecQ
VIAGGDALVLMPTGGGKSLCYQIPALCRSGVAIVVSPLIALMRDQVAALRQLGVRAACLNSSIAFGEQVATERAMRNGELDIVYVAPERLLSDGCLALLGHCEIALFAIDEAHCVSQWGHDFRPEYLKLAVLGTLFPGVPRIALTATADTPTRQEIVEKLVLDGGRHFVAGFDRPNIRYHVGAKDGGAHPQLLSFIAGRHAGESGIVYRATRAAVEDTAQWLAAKGIDAVPYHAGLDRAVREANQDRFAREEAVVVVATIAFGMGIDKPNVRFVAHLDLPKSLEAYYQETGRAGRDGLPADAWMLYGLQDIAWLRQMIADGEASDDKKRLDQRKLDLLIGYCETTRCRRQVLLEYFGDSGAPCGNCDTCLEPVASFDATEAARKALSCVFRTGQIFGAGHLIDVLLGADTERVRKFGHDRLSTFGIGREFERTEWRSLFRQLVAAGHLTVDVAGHGSLKLTDQCRPLLRGETSLSLRREPPRRKPAKQRRDATAHDDPLFQTLRQLRFALAKAQGVPPYVIFSDASLRDMAQLRPATLDQFAEISGVGSVKLARYGQIFIDAIGQGPDPAR